MSRNGIQIRRYCTKSFKLSVKYIEENESTESFKTHI